MSNLHVIISEDDFLIAETVKKIVGDDDGGFEIIDSNTSTNEELRLADLRAVDASFCTPPFLSPTKITWWKNVRILPGGKTKGEKDEKVSEAVKEGLVKFVKKLSANPLPPNQKFILSGPKLLQTSDVAKVLKGCAEVLVFAKGKAKEEENSAILRAKEFAREFGFTFDSDAAKRFVEIVGTDTRSLLSEVGKLRDYLGRDNNVATTNDVMEISSPGVGVEPALWAVTKAIEKRDLRALVESVRRFEMEDGFAVMMTTVVEKFFRQLVEMKDAQMRGKPIDNNDGRPSWAVQKTMDCLRNWTLRELRVARYRFLTLREKAVSSSGSADVLVLTELVRVCRR